MTQAERADIFENLTVKKSLMKQIMPSIASQVIMLIYNLADTYFVGRLNDPRETAGMTAVASSLVIITAISNLFGVGGASTIARFLGKYDIESARKTSAVAVYGGFLVSAAFCILYFIFASPILRLCGADADIWEPAYGYALWVMVIGSPGAIMSALLANLIRAEGGAKVASLGLSAGGVLNIILDPFFTLPEFMGCGATGAGMATAISNMLVFAFFVVYVISRRTQSVIDLIPTHFCGGMKYLKSVLSIGFPSAVQYMLTVVAVSAQIHFVSNYKTEALAALGIVRKLDMLPLYCALGVSSGLLPLLAYNYAAKKYERQKQALLHGIKIAVGF